jgi:23S rRNA-/tRNA-specific pseudouridylate synthase
VPQEDRAGQRRGGAVCIVRSRLSSVWCGEPPFGSSHTARKVHSVQQHHVLDLATASQGYHASGSLLFSAQSAAREGVDTQQTVRVSVCPCVSARSVVQGGDVVQFIVPQAKPDGGLVVPVLFEDEHMAVVLKPAGVKIHGRGNTVG